MAEDAHDRKTALVTGATGFIGMHLVDSLLRKGYSVTCLVRSSSDTQRLQKFPVRLVFGSLDTRRAIREASVEPGIVFHIAGLTKARNRAEFFHVNQTGTANLLEILAEAEHRPLRFVHSSSLAAAGPSTLQRQLTEDDDPKPVSWYGESKLESEREVQKFADVFPVTILRPSAVYGPGDRDIYLIFRMIQKGCFVVPGRSVHPFSLIHVQDVVDAFLQAGESDTPSGEVFFISHPEIQTWETVGRIIARELGKTCLRFSVPQWLALAAGSAGSAYSSLTGKMVALNIHKVREILQPAWTCDPSKAQAILGFAPRVNLENGIQDTVRWYKQNGWL